MHLHEMKSYLHVKTKRRDKVQEDKRECEITHNNASGRECEEIVKHFGHSIPHKIGPYATSNSTRCHSTQSSTHKSHIITGIETVPELHRKSEHLINEISFTLQNIPYGRKYVSQNGPSFCSALVNNKPKPAIGESIPLVDTVPQTQRKLSQQK
jgi:hypothetical protein